MSEDIELLPMRASDVPAVVSIHEEAFPGFFLTFLGAGFLRELYAGLVEDRDRIAFVAVRRGVTGFVAGTARPEGFYRRLIRERGARFALGSLPALLRRPSTARRLIRALAKPSESRAYGDAALLMSVAVRPSEFGAGTGGRLVRRFVEEASSRGLRRVVLTTDRDGNDRVNAFYRSLGFTVARTFVTPEGREMNEYLLRLQES
jgi:ribosomal protein S18 acetylase RimI-like enzyme